MENITTKEGLKIISTELMNFQSLTHKLVEIQGKSIVIIGKNGGSKSTLLRAIQSPLNSEVIPSKPIKTGEENASVRVVVGGNIDGEDKQYVYNIFFNEQNQKGKITVLDEQGTEYKTRSMQKDILGDISFDVDQFIRLGMTANGSKSVAGVREQVEILRKFLSPDERKKLNSLDSEYKTKYELRTDVNKDIAKMKLKISEVPKMTEEEIKTYSIDKSEEATKLQATLGNISEAMVKWDRVNKGTADTNKKITELEEELKVLKEQKAKGEAWLKANAKPQVEELQEQLKAVTEHQKYFNAVSNLNNLVIDLKSEEKQSEVITERLKKIQEEKASVFENSTMPVKGLSFDEDGVYYKGLPFNDDHHPSSTIISVGVQLAIAMNPHLKCIFIKDGSLLDKTTFSKVLKFVESKGYQLFIEMVDWDAKGDVAVQFAESFITE